MATEERKHGWIAITPGSLEQTPEEQRRRLEQRMREHEVARGRLLAHVSVDVYEHEAVPQVQFSEACQLGPDADGEVIAGVVARAREQLAQWR